MPNFKLLLQTFKEEQLAKALNDMGVRSWKLLLVDSAQPSSFVASLPQYSGLDFIIFVDPEDGITHYHIRKINQKVLLSLRKINRGCSFSVETKDSFRSKYLSRKLLTVDAIEEILQKADTLDNLYDKVSGVNKADAALPAAAAADNVNVPSSPTAADTSAVADSSSKMGLFSSSTPKVSSDDFSEKRSPEENIFLEYMKKLAPDIRQKRLAEIIDKISNFDAKNIANAIGNTPSCS